MQRPRRRRTASTARTTTGLWRLGGDCVKGGLSLLNWHRRSTTQILCKVSGDPAGGRRNANRDPTSQDLSQRLCRQAVARRPYSRTTTLRAYIIPTVLAVLLASSSLALASQSEGTVKAIDAKAMTLTLHNGTVFYLPKTFKEPGLKAGDKVNVAWEMLQGRHEATKVTIVK